MNDRVITQVLQAPEIAEGPEFVIRRAIPHYNAANLGPILLLDQIGPRVVSPGAQIALPPHPHAGMETLTYLLEGSTEHHDSAGHSETIYAGEVQWMRAGRGIIHSEGPGISLQQSGGRLHAVQLWINLPKGRKHVDPAYRGYRRNELPTMTINEAQIRLLAGAIGGAQGPIVTFAEPFALHATFDCPGTAQIPVPAGIELGLYVMTGEVRVAASQPLTPGSLAILGDGTSVHIDAHEPSNIMLVGGPTLDAPIVRHGPFVMSNDEEIRRALHDHRTGRMGSLHARLPTPSPPPTHNEKSDFSNET